MAASKIMKLFYGYEITSRFYFYFFPSLFSLSFLLLFPTFRWRSFVLFILFSFFLFFTFIVSLSFVWLFRCPLSLAESVMFFRFVLLLYPLPLSVCDRLLFPFFATLHLFVSLYLISAFIKSLIQKPHYLCKIGRLNPGWESTVLDCLYLRR